MRAAECPSTKQLYPMGSRVGIGCLAKGRSASRLLDQELRTQVPDLFNRARPLPWIRVYPYPIKFG